MTLGRRRRIWPLAALGVTTLWAGRATSVDGPTTSPTATPSTSPATTAPAVNSDVDRLLPGLSDPDWRVRQRAVAALANLGEPAEPRLADFARTTPDDEARDRARVALQQIAALRRLGPTRVTLGLAGVAPREAFAELARQGHVQLRARRESLWREGEFPPVTLDLRDVPFWQAAKAVCAASRLKPMFEGGEYGDPPRLVLVPDLTGDMTNPAATSGAFTVVLTSLARRPRFGRPDAGEAELMLTFYADPKLRVLEHPAGVRVESVAGPGGEPLPRPGPMALLPFKDRSPIWVARGAVAGVPAGADRLGRLAGSFRVTVLEQSDLAEIVDPMRSANAVSRSSGQSLHLAGLARDPQGVRQYRARLILTRGGLTGQDWRTAAEADGIQLLDAKGRAYRRVAAEARESGPQVTHDLTFQAPADDAGPPAKITWQVPLEARELTVPFEFGELPFTQ